MVANNQFSALGLVLLAELAKVARIIHSPADAVGALGASPLTRVEGHQDSDAAFLAEDLGEAVPRISTSKPFTEKLQSDDADRGILLDTGETGRAASPAAMVKSRDLDDQSVPIEASAQVPSQRTRRQRRKGMNAIGDLFSGLG